ncbi:MAG TPA: hypothetical protein VLB49_16555, partial [Gemmatimonadales bacterium]|nr:hypothetical protein [Gemmatimonadales bacterium]
MADQPSRVRSLALTASVVLAVSLATCTRESAGPPRHAAFSVAPVLPSGTSLAAFNLSIDNVRLIVVRPPADTVFDQTFAFPANQSSLPISADIPLEQSPETFQVTIQLLSGTTLLFGGTQSVSVTADAVTPPAQIPVTYSGPGQNVATLTIDPPDSVLTQGGTLQFRLTAKDAQGVIVPTFYASWTTSDTNVAKVDATGVLTAPLSRATLNVIARTPPTQSQPNGVSSSTPITFIPTPVAIQIVSGCGQSGQPGAQLSQPIVARVVAGDNLGVKGITVQFTAPAGGSVAASQVITDANGLAQTTVTLPTQGPATFTISAPGLTAQQCNQTLVIGATQLAFTPQPPATVTAGAGLTVVVTAQDAQGNTATSFAGAITLSLGTHPAGAVLSGTVTVNAVGGVATFANFGLLTVAGTYTLVASTSSLPSVTSTPFDVLPGATTQLAFSVEPTNVGAGSLITPPVAVAAQDAFGNPTPAFTGNITVALGTNPTSATLGGTLTQPASAGVATFSDLTVNKVGSGYALSASAAGLTGASSTTFNVTTVPATQLVFQTQPVNVVAGSPIAVTVAAMDGLGNVVTSFTGPVTITIGANPGGGVLSGSTPVNAVAGVATFANLSIDKSGNGYSLVATGVGLIPATSAAFNVTPGAATQLVFTQQPPATVVAGTGFTIVVTARDGQGNTATGFTANVSLAFGSHPVGSVLAGTTTVAAANGVATFAALAPLTVAGGYTLVASSTGLQGVTSSSFTVTPAAAAALAFTTQPSTVASGAPITPAVQVAVQDNFGNTVTTATNAITVSLT